MNGFESPESNMNVSPEPPGSKTKSGAKSLYEQKKNFSRSRTRTRTSINSLTETTQYHVEHLTSFVLDRKDGMMTVEDGLRRLRLLDARGKIWTQEMLLEVEPKTLGLLDLESQKELERFPLASVQFCQALMNSCSYDSVLALICKEPGQNKPDLHLFQCDHTKASLIQADVESAMSDARGGRGGVKKRPDVLMMLLKSEEVIPPPPDNPAPEPPAPSNQVDVKSRAAAWSAWTNEQQDDQRQQRVWEVEDPPEVAVAAARVDQDVRVLNRLLDHIEDFVTRLQKASEALSQLERRKKNRRNRKPAPGEGVLTLRSRPPAEEEFIDCLQKFKHAFNQLARLKDQIQNPSAVDLIHFLFSPLRMVIQASGSVELARSVVVPLLTRDAIEFLHASGTAEERHLWVTLGDGWTKCRLEWPKDHYFPPCVLRFPDGWEPPLSGTQEDLTDEVGGAVVQKKEELNLNQEGVLQRFFMGNRVDQDQNSLRQTFSQRTERNFSLQNKVFAKSKYDFVARNSTELSVLRDEVLEVLDDRRQWWKVVNGCGASGYVPNNILETSQGVELVGRGEPIYSHTIQLMMPKKEFELFKQLLGELNEKQTNHSDFLSGKPAAPPPKIPTPPLPPPSPSPTTPTTPTTLTPPTTPNPPTAVSRQNSDTKDQKPPAGRRRSTMEEVQEELLHRLTLGRSSQKKLPAAAATPSISYDSSPQEVKAWLENKGFSPVTSSSLGVLTGAQLFSLNKEELKTVCPDDGARVFSQVTVQKAALEVFF